ncbi:MAG: heparinase II/III family protein, partial [Oscillospiraceae bacterium]|nr:heparinase II/III family protein [Oscillospiraceae bacterium]
MKRLLSAVIAIAMFISLLPVTSVSVFASTGVDVIRYDLAKVLEENGFTHNSGKTVSEIAKALAGNLFEFSAVADDKTSSGGGSIRFRNYAGNYNIQIVKNKWIEFNIYVPEKADYTLDVYYGLYKEHGTVDIYLDGAEASIGSYDIYAEGKTFNVLSSTPYTVSNVSLSEGWHTIKFTATGGAGSVSTFVLRKPKPVLPPLDYAGTEYNTEYNFIMLSDSWDPLANEDQKLPDTISKNDIRGIKYEHTVGKNWCWYGIGPEYLADNTTAHVYRYNGKFDATDRLRLMLPYQKWAAFKIIVPEIGKYAVSLEYAAYNTTAGECDIYIVPLVDEDKIDALLINDNYVGHVNFLDDETWSVADEYLGLKDFYEAGEHLLVFKNTSSKGIRRHITPRKLYIEGANIFKTVELSIDKTGTFGYGDTAQISVTAKLADGTELDKSEYSVSYATSNENIIAVDAKGKVTARGDGQAKVFVAVTSNGFTRTEELVISAIDDTAVKEITLDISENMFVGETAKFSFTALMESKNRIPISEDVTYTYSSDGIVSVESGIVNALSEGTVRVTANAVFRDEPVSDYVDITVINHDGKKGSNIYTDEKRENAVENIKKYEWAKKEAEAAISVADKYLESYEFLYNHIPYDSFPRSRQVGERGDPEYNLCRYCGVDIEGTYGANGSGAWVINIFSRPWKVQCPDCKRIFPSNDFESFYNLGLSEDGKWSKQRALDAHREMLIEKGLLSDTGEDAPAEEYSDAWYKYYGYGVEGGYLYNETYTELWKADSTKRNIDPRTGEAVDGLRWGVDDGFGYLPGRLCTETQPERHCYIALYSFFMWGNVRSAIRYLADAYVYTGEEKYAIAGGMLLDRVADVFPGYDISVYNDSGYVKCMINDGGSGFGAVQGRITDCELGVVLARACDAFFPILKNEKFLNTMAEVKPEQTSSVKIWEYWEKNVLEEIFESAKDGQLNGNFGMAEEAVGTVAIVLDREPKTTEILEWLYAPNTGDEKQNIQGGQLELTIVNTVDRDGMGNESAPYYNITWLDRLCTLADVLTLYKGNGDYGLYDNPKFAKMFTTALPITITESHHAQIADSGQIAGIEYAGNINIYIQAFKQLMNTPYAEEIAQYIYLRNGKTTDNLHYDILEENPERLQDELLLHVDEKNPARSEMMAGYGFAVLRDGGNYTSASLMTSNNNLRDFWIYFGRNNVSHSHNDTLNIGIEAFGLNLAPDIGYPTNTGNNPERMQWISAMLSHNTVMVNEKQVQDMTVGRPLHFDSTENVKLVDVDASAAYDETDAYRRSLVMIKVNDDISYGVDFFRITGGDKHTFSFHAQSETATGVEGLDGLTHDEVVKDEFGNDIVGSYAGADVPQGPDPYSRTDTSSYETKYPHGYTWLYDVRRDKSAENQFAVDFEITDYRKAIENNKNIHLRVTQLNKFKPSEVALAKGPVPPKTENLSLPKGLEYMLVQREGENLDTLFTTVFEPYRGSRYIESIEALTIDGVDEADNSVIAVKVTHTDKERFDYVVYATDNSKLYTVRDTDESVALTFRGFVGVVTKNASGAVIYCYVNDGDDISGATGTDGIYEGSVKAFQKDLSDDNFIDVSFDGEVDLSKLHGRYIYIENSTGINAVYPIKSVQDNRESVGTVRLGTGTVTLINGNKDFFDEQKGYQYNIQEEQRFAIPLSYEEDFTPVFDDVSDNITTSAGSSVSVTVNAESTITDNPPAITYIGTTLPRGASLNSATGTVTWKPDSSQIGENHFAITARDADGRESTVHFNIMVYGSTTGEKNQITETTGAETTGTPSAGGGGGGGGGGAAPVPTDTPETGKDDESLLLEEKVPSTGEADEVEKPQFTDLGNHEWAEDAINT